MSEIWEYACRVLARREHSVGELRRKIEEKWPGQSETEEVLLRLVERGLLSDVRFARSFVRSRVARNQGPLKIRLELKRRDLDGPDIDAALEDYVDSWTDLAIRWLFRQGVDPSDYKSRAKYYRRLLNRGFTHDQAMKALASVAREE